MNRKIKLLLEGTAVLTALLTFNSAKVSAQSNKSSLVRTTQFGKVKGIKENNTLNWRGIPYGGSVAGSHRWKAPTNPKKWKKTKTTVKTITAVQYNNNKVTGSESKALTLDITRPNNNKKNLPVLVYIHGGNNQTGTSQEIDGSDFVRKHNAVYVAINYRLGALGFNPLQALKGKDRYVNSGNYALLDMHKALNWVNKNIGNFGGNKKNIIVSGFSAGGRDVMAMLISPMFHNQFKRAIVFSGGMTLSDVKKSQKVYAKAFAPLVVEDKKAKNEQQAERWLLSSKNKKQVKKYLYSIKANRLAKLMGNASIRMSVFPHLFKDGVVIPKSGFNTTKYNNVPTLITTGSREFSLFSAFDPYFVKYATTGKLMGNNEIGKEYQFVFKNGGKLYGRFNLEDSANKMLDQGFKSKLYGLQINFGNDPKVVGNKMAMLGAFHGVFVPLLDPSSQSYNALVGDAYQSNGAKELSTNFQNYIYDFMTGNRMWTPYSKDTRKVLNIDATKDKTQATLKTTAFTDNDILNEMSNDDTITANKKEYLIKHVMNGRWFSHQLDEKYNNLSDFDK